MFKLAEVGFDDLFRRFGGSKNEEIANILVEAAFARAVTLHWLGRPEANQALEALVAQHSNSANSEVRKFVAKANEYLASPQAKWEYLDGSWD
jgi:hypothetical protein